MQDIRATIIGIMREQPLEPGVLEMLAAPPEDFAIADVAFGSLEALVLCLEIEQALGVPLEVAELAGLERFSDLVAHVAGRLEQQAV